MSGVPFFVVFFGPEPGTKKPPFWGGFLTIFVTPRKWFLCLILCGFRE
jgi:hypothetical protein